MNIEESLKRLEELTKEMESGVSIEEGMRLFEEGLSITKECMNLLKEYKGKLNQIKSEMDSLFRNNVMKTKEDIDILINREISRAGFDVKLLEIINYVFLPGARDLGL